jgi:DNA segregation ATPase FtsK/SpoIIIE-like protein
MEIAMNKQHALRFVLSRWLPLLILAFGAATAGAQQDVDPPARVASLSVIDGSVVFAPAGQSEWVDAVLNRPITRGDRLWTDRGARAELHVGSAVLHLDDQTFLDVTDLDDDVLQVSLNEGTVNARVRELARGENFEIDTPQLAFRASRPGDYRVDVDPAQGTTRVTVRSGSALVYGANGQPQELLGGQAVTFAGTDLERINAQALPPPDSFDRWAADRNRAEDESIAARYVPRDVVGYQQLDAYGSWAQDPSYGAVWYPRVTVADWAPYRYGHWEYIAPWGWTWIDDAPWGFAPSHYGRWAMIGSRWCWVPGRIGPRPVYSPALVVFVGGGGGVSLSLSFGSSSGIGWFPLAPGEAWRPYYRTSPRYVAGVNRYIVNNQVTNNYFYINQRHPSAVTAVRMEDFSGSRPVHRNRRQVDATELDRVRIAAQPTLPEPRRIVESRPSRTRTLPPPNLSAVPVPLQPQPGSPGPAIRRRDGTDQRPIAAPRPQLQEPRREVERDARQQERQEERQRREADREQERSARDQERARRDQQVQQERVSREQERARRDQQVQQQERIQREQQVQAQRDHALRQQQQAQERAQRQQQQAQEQANRQQQQAQERAQRQQQAAQEQMLRQQQQQQRQEQQRALRQPPQPQPQVAPPMEQPAPRERARGKPEREPREDNRSQGGEEGGRGRGQGRGG